MTVKDFSEFLKSFGSTKFKELWPAQAEVLDNYVATHSSARDVAVELPTGAGKTLIALLLAESRRREGQQRVAILSANKTLARQMVDEATALGIPVVLMEGKGTEIPATVKRAYARGTHVAVMNYWVYYNQNPAIDPADLLIMDDAHLAEHCLHSLYSLEIDRFAHEALFKTIASELATRFPEYAALSDALNDDSPPGTSTELLSFFDQHEASGRIREILDSSHLKEADKDLYYRWGRIRPNFVEANWYVSSRSIWIRPYVYPLTTNPYYSHPAQTVYLSATVGDPGDLARRLGVRPITRIPVTSPQGESTSGRRLVVMNRVGEGDIPPKMQSILLAALNVSPKSLWLCSSDKEANQFREIVMKWLEANGITGHPSWLLTPTGDEIDQFRNASAGHLFVAGRFDGMDFRDDQCRIVVLTTVPRAINLQEEFSATYLRDAGFMRRRLNHRIIQALGRCTRSPDDYALYLLADERFPVHFGRDANLEGIPSSIIAELDMAQDLADLSADDVVHRCVEFLSGKFAPYDTAISQYRALGPPPRAAITPPDTSAEEVEGWAALFQSHNFPAAADMFESCWNKFRPFDRTDIGALHGWHWAKALFLQSVHGDAAARAKAAIVLKDAIGKGGQSSWFNRMRASLARATKNAAAQIQASEREYGDALIRVFDEQLEKLGAKGDKFQKYCNNITAKLASDDHNTFQEGLVALGSVLGYSATRPKYSAATDCRWRGIFGNVKEVVTFEAKIEHLPSTCISAKDIGQAHNQHSRAVSELGPQGFAVRSVLVTHLTSFCEGAQPSLGTIRILTKHATQELWARLASLLSQYRSGWSVDDLSTRGSAAESLRPHVPNSGWLGRALDSAGQQIEAAQLLAEWK